MKPQDQIKALAELDGWQRCTWYDGYNIDGNGNTTWRKAYVRTGEEIKYADEFPNYLTSYDAIIPLIQKQDWKTQCEVAIQLRIYWQKQTNACPTINNLEGWCIWCMLSTPAQLCEALLRATGKWKD